MTNREWLNSLSNEDFVEWLIYDEVWEASDGCIKIYQPHPKLGTLRRSSTQTGSFIREWLNKERDPANINETIYEKLVTLDMPESKN